MNTRHCAFVLLAAGLSLSGCKTMDHSVAVAPAPQSAQPGTMYEPRFEENKAYVNYVESVARRRGVYVRWVNKPVTRHVDQ